MKKVFMLLGLLMGCAPNKPVVEMRPSRVEAKESENETYQAVINKESLDFDSIVAIFHCLKMAQDSKTAISERLSQEPMFQKAMRQVLDTRGWEFFFSTPQGTVQGFELLLGAIKSLPEHGLSEEKYAVEKIEEAKANLLSLADKVMKKRKELSEIKGWDIIQPLVERQETPTIEEFEAMKESGKIAGEGYADIVIRGLDYCNAVKSLTKMRAEIEVLAMVSFFRYALDMKFLILAHPFKAEVGYEKADLRHHDELIQAFERFAKNPSDGLDWFIPKSPYYKKVQEGLKYYKKLAQEETIKEITFKGKLKKGMKGKVIKEIKERLKFEGYFNGQIDENFDKSLEDAVKAYQETHQYHPTGILEERHLKSINITMEKRVKQIELSLRRFRESELRPEEPIYVRVNIPEFMMEVWADGERVLKHKVCTGSNAEDRDPDLDIKGRINRTKIFSAKIQKIILNPKWHVPSRIKKLELDYELLKEPDYYHKHNFKVKVLPDGREEIYQDSGVKNALGKVKFLFPNQFGIFMHDTPQKNLFEKEIRAFSHGCIRLQDPLKVAFFLLERCAGIDETKANAILASQKEREITLETKVPIFVEYNTVGVNDNGRLEFYADVYEYDKDYFEGKLPYPPEVLKILLQKVRKVD